MHIIIALLGRQREFPIVDSTKPDEARFAEILHLLVPCMSMCENKLSVPGSQFPMCSHFATFPVYQASNNMFSVKIICEDVCVHSSIIVQRLNFA